MTESSDENQPEVVIQEDDEQQPVDDPEPCDDEDYVITAGDDDNSSDVCIDDDDEPFQNERARFIAEVNCYNAYVFNMPACLVNDCRINISIKRDILPLALQSAYGLLGSPIMLDIGLELCNFNWTIRPAYCSVTHPIYKNNFVGYPLIRDIIDKFFSPHFKPRESYKAATNILIPQGHSDEKLIAKLIKEGFDRDHAESALVLCQHNYDAARDFLRTGTPPKSRTECTVPFKECPLIYFILEIVEAFIDLTDHCCICRAKLPMKGVKPNVCDKPVCSFSLASIGVGTSLLQELRRDPLTADLLLSCFAMSLNGQFVIPPHPEYSPSDCKNIIAKMPPIDTMINDAQDDQGLHKMIGPEAMNVLRWVVLSCRFHLMNLPPKMYMKEFSQSYQFMTIMATPSAEKKFAKLKAEYGSEFLFHGSACSRWHSIIRNGLKNATGTPMMACGAACGPGIYLARQRSTSAGYCGTENNTYTASAFKGNCQIMALCEVAKVPELADHQWCHTCTNEAAVLVRFLLVGSPSQDRDVISNPPSSIPSLEDVLNYYAEKK